MQEHLVMSPTTSIDIGTYSGHTSSNRESFTSQEDNGEVLMNMIADEMVQSFGNIMVEPVDFADEEDMELLQALYDNMEAKKKKASRRRSSIKKKRASFVNPAGECQDLDISNSQLLEHVYYSHMNGEDPSERYDASSSSFAVESNNNNNDMARPAPSPPTPSKKKTKKRNSLVSVGSRKGGATKQKSQVPKRRSSTESSKDSDSNNMTARTISIDEVQEYVMDRLPQSIKEAIPEEAWSQIFAETSSRDVVSSSSRGSTTQKSKEADSSNIVSDSSTSNNYNKKKQHRRQSATKQRPFNEILVDKLPEVHESTEETEDMDDDDDTVLSDITGLTGIFPEGKSVHSRRLSMASTEVSGATGMTADMTEDHVENEIIAPESKPSEEEKSSRHRRKLQPGLSTRSLAIDEDGICPSLAPEFQNRRSSVHASPFSDPGFIDAEIIEYIDPPGSCSSFNNNDNDGRPQDERSSSSSLPPQIKKTHSKKFKSSPTRKVTFDEVRVRYYERIVGDNPSATSGPPIGIGWRFKRASPVSVDEWENQRGPPRSPGQLLIPKDNRMYMLLEIGYTHKELAAAVRAALKVKNNRRQTINNLGAQKMEETIELAQRRVSKILTFGFSNNIFKNIQMNSK